MIHGSPSLPEAYPKREWAVPPAGSDAAMLEVEIADLIKSEFNAGHSKDRDGQRAAWDEASTSQQWADTAHEANDVAVDRDLAREHPAWKDMKIYDPEKLAGLASSCIRMRRLVVIVSLLSLGGIAGLGAWNLSYFVKPVPRSVPIEQKATMLALPPTAVEPSRQALPSASTTKIDDLIAKELGNRRTPTQKPLPTAENTKKAALTPQNTAPVPATTAVHRQPKPLPAPFPETKPTTIDGWTVREVANGTAVVQGPNGVWKVSRGDTVPGLGKIESIVVWGNRWLVATSRGLISTQ